ncbi:MAG: diol dehydratase small subunit [Chloroflexota bacterium]
MSEHNGAAHYPLAEHAADRLRSRTGIPFERITLEALRAGEIDSDDLTVNGETLLLQAGVAERAGYRQLAENLRRAAELVEIPNERLLQIYEALRPRRSTYPELMALADELETQYAASANARFVRQAAEAYRAGDLSRAEQ